MSRRLRPNLPGVPFHVTARVHDREPLLVGLESQVASLICSVAEQEGCCVLAYVVMSNHLHVLVIQGERPLATYMQPLLRRVALLVLQSTGRQGHVFGRRYSDHACLDPHYLRDCIAYIHLNPVRAELCADPGAYDWSSHRLYARPARDTTSAGLWAEIGLRAFAGSEAIDRATLCRSYRDYVAWRIKADRFAAAGPLALRRTPPPPSTRAGDVNWWHDLGVRCRLAEHRLRPPPRPAELSLIARSCLGDAPDATLEILRSGARTRPVVQLRHEFIRRAVSAGHRCSQIARYLRVSNSAVSDIAAPLRTPYS